MLAPGLLEAVNPDVKAGILALVFPNFLSLTSFRLSLLPILFPVAGGAIIDAVAKDTEADWEPVNLVLNEVPPELLVLLDPIRAVNPPTEATGVVNVCTSGCGTCPGVITLLVAEEENVVVGVGFEIQVVPLLVTMTVC